MKIAIQFFVVYLSIVFLSSCSTANIPVVAADKNTSEIIPESKPTRGLEYASITNGLFAVWNDSALRDTDVADLVNQADKMIQFKQWADAQGKLERTLRLSPQYAPAWSRLSWLSLRSAQLKKSIKLAKRSNNHTNSTQLKKLNFSFMRDAYKLMGKPTEVKKINQIIKQLSSDT